MATTDVADTAQAEANKLVAKGRLLVEPHGRRWLMLGARKGFTHSVHGDWWYGDRLHPREHELTIVSSTYVIAALEAWELSVAVVDSDPTEAQGIEQPIVVVKASDVACPVCLVVAGQSCCYVADGTLKDRAAHPARYELAAEVRLPAGIALVAS